MFTLQNYFQASWHGFVAGVTALAVVAMTFFMLEPRIGLAQPNVSTFTISQDIVGEISFLVPAANVSMVGSLSGITGGTANGSTTFVVRSNSSAGHTVNIAFFNNGSAQAMQGINSLSDSIRDYPATSSEPTFTFSTASTSAVFGYNVRSNDPADLDQSFLNNGSVCNSVGGSSTVDRCWMEPRTTSFQIIDSDQEALTGATSTLFFRVHVPSNPTPGLVTDTYRATATLTAVNK